MSRTNKTQFALLSWLTLEPMTAYEIKQAMAESTQYFWYESDGQIYPGLRDLVEHGLASVKEVTAQKNATKKVYTITDKGRETWHNWLEAPPLHAKPREELLLKCFFARTTDKKIIKKHLQNKLNELENAKNVLTMIFEKVKARQEMRKDYWLMTIDFGLKMVTAEIDWCKQWLSQL